MTFFPPSIVLALSEIGVGGGLGKEEEEEERRRMRRRKGGKEEEEGSFKARRRRTEVIQAGAVNKKDSEREHATLV